MPSPFPPELTAYLKAHHATLYPDLKDLWDANGDKTSGTWAEVFGDTNRADEIFMAWHYARFIQAVAAQGKAAYDIPMYVNTWLAGDTTPPGDYPSGGPEPWVDLDVWQRRSGTALDFYSPDLYAPTSPSGASATIATATRSTCLRRAAGTPERPTSFTPSAKTRPWVFRPSPLKAETTPKSSLPDSYMAIAAIAPSSWHQAAGDMHGFVLDKAHPAVDFTINGYTLHVALDEHLRRPR